MPKILLIDAQGERLNGEVAHLPGYGDAAMPPVVLYRVSNLMYDVYSHFTLTNEMDDNRHVYREVPTVSFAQPEN